MSFFRTISTARPRPRCALTHHRPLPIAVRARGLSTARPTTTPCASCGRPLPTNLPACTGCWTIRALPTGTTHHELFGLPAAPNPFDVDAALLKRRFLAAQSSCHPDAWATKSSTDGELAHALSSRLNDAYQTLLHPLSRAEYILAQHGQAVAEGDQVEDQAFMMEVMEARETIEEATPADVGAIEELLARNRAHSSETTAEIRDLAAKQAWGPMKAAVIRLRYLHGITRAGQQWLDNV